MIKRLLKDKVFYLSIVILAIFILFGISSLESLNIFVGNVVEMINTDLPWFYVLVYGVFLASCVYLLFSRYRNIKLGKDREKPAYTFASWFSMLFSAGMGIGLVFWGVAEPISHYIHPNGMKGMTVEAKNFALSKSFLHWGISAWACYAILALIIAYFQFRKDKPMLMSYILEPIIGEKNRKGLVGTGIDVFTVLATIAGIVTSLGLGTLQINGGLNYLFGIPTNQWVQVIIIGVITMFFLASAISGLDNGIQKISNLNLILGFILLVSCFLIGPISATIQNLQEGLKNYVPEVIKGLDPTVRGEWHSKWTIYYWATWICWAPPVGIFIARISRGRTIKEFLLGVLIVPGLVCMIWFSVFGTLAMEAPNAVILEASKVTETALFTILKAYPFGSVLSILSIILIGTFFITSADSTTFVLSMLTSQGNLNPPNGKKVVLGLSISGLTILFLIAGGLPLIQNISTMGALPFAFVMVASILSFFKTLKEEEFSTVKSYAMKTAMAARNSTIK